jgi:hypothetical protein
MGVVTPTVNPEPEIVSCVMETATDPVLVIFTVCVIAVFRTCVPNARLLGVADKLGEPLTGVGLGTGVGEPFAVCGPPPHPIALAMRTIKIRKRPS